MVKKEFLRSAGKLYAQRASAQAPYGAASPNKPEWKCYHGIIVTIAKLLFHVVCDGTTACQKECSPNEGNLVQQQR